MNVPGALPAATAPAPHLAPGRMGIRLALLSAAIGLAAVNTGNNLLYVMLSLILGLAGVSLVAARLALRTLRVRAILPAEAVSGEPFLMTVEVQGRFPWLPQTWVDVRVRGLDQELVVTVPLAAATGRGALITRLTAPRRGVYTRLRLEASTGYPLDLHLSRAAFAWTGELVVLPRLRPVELPDARAAAGPLPGAAPALRGSGMGADLRNVRAYTWQDDARHMHWRATARAGHPMVRELDPERERRLDVVLVTEASDPAAFEEVVSRAASLMEAARQEQIPVRLHARGAAREGLTGPAAGRFLAQVSCAPPGSVGADAGGFVPPGAIVLACAHPRGPARPEGAR